jgi:hypothetical protein
MEGLPMWKKVVGVVGFLGALSGIKPVYDSAKDFVKEGIDGYVHAQVEIKIKEAHSNKTGGYRHQTAEELERLGHTVDPSDLPAEIAKVIIWADSMKTFNANLQFENKYQSVGLFRNKTTGFFWYRSTDGELYRAYAVNNIDVEHNGYFRYLDKHGNPGIIWIPSH